MVAWSHKRCLDPCKLRAEFVELWVQIARVGLDASLIFGNERWAIAPVRTAAKPIPTIMTVINGVGVGMFSAVANA